MLMGNALLQSVFAMELPFSSEERMRYERHLILPHFGEEAQHLLKNARVLIVGTGGLGSPLALYLAAAGTGTLGLLDFDTVELCNLQRQVLFNTTDTGISKVKAGAARLQALNPHVHIIQHAQRLTVDNAAEIFAQYDLIADGSDNFPTRYLVNDTCVQLHKPCVYGSVQQFEGHVSVFHVAEAEGGYSPDYRDLYPAPPPSEMIPDCASGGVLGPLPGIIGTMQALEVIKLITGIGELLCGRLLIFDGLTMQSRVFRYGPHPQNPLRQPNNRSALLRDYHGFCDFSDQGEESEVPEISPALLRRWQQEGEVLQLIDVREPREHLFDPLGGELIPLAQITTAAHRIARDCKVVFYCQAGLRSATAIRLLRQHDDWPHLYHLRGGLEHWSRTEKQ